MKIDKVMKKIIFFIVLSFWHLQAAAALTIEITEGAEGSLPIAVVPFGSEGSGVGPGEQIARIISEDLKRSGRFKTLPVGDMLARPHAGSEVEFRDWKVLGMENLVWVRSSPTAPAATWSAFSFSMSTRESSSPGTTYPPRSATCGQQLITSRISSMKS